MDEEAGGDGGGGDSNAKNSKSRSGKVIGNSSGRAPRNGGAPAGSGSRLSRDCLRGCSCRRRRWRALSSLKRRGIHPARRARARNGKRIGKALDDEIEVQTALKTVLKRKNHNKNPLQNCTRIRGSQ